MFNGGLGSIAMKDDAFVIPREPHLDAYVRRLTRRGTSQPVYRPKRNPFASLFEMPQPIAPRKPVRRQAMPTRCTCPTRRVNSRTRFKPVSVPVETLGDLGFADKLFALPTTMPGWTWEHGSPVPLYAANAAPVTVVDGRTNAQPFLPAQPAGATKFDTVTDLISRGLDTFRETRGLAPQTTSSSSSAPLVSAGVNTPVGSVGGNVGIGLNPDGSLSLGGGGSISPMLLLGGAVVLLLLLKKK